MSLSSLASLTYPPLGSFTSFTGVAISNAWLDFVKSCVDNGYSEHFM